MFVSTRLVDIYHSLCDSSHKSSARDSTYIRYSILATFSLDRRALTLRWSTLDTHAHSLDRHSSCDMWHVLDIRHSLNSRLFHSIRDRSRSTLIRHATFSQSTCESLDALSHPIDACVTRRLSTFVRYTWQLDRYALHIRLTRSINLSRQLVSLFALHSRYSPCGTCFVRRLVICSVFDHSTRHVWHSCSLDIRSLSLRQMTQICRRGDRCIRCGWECLFHENSSQNRVIYNV